MFRCKLRKPELCYICKVEDKYLWLCMLGYLGREGLWKLGLSFSTSKCAKWVESKTTKLPFMRHIKWTFHVVELIHSDICEPVTFLTPGQEILPGNSSWFSQLVIVKI